MTKHPNSFKLNGDLVEKNAAVTAERTVLYDGESIYINYLKNTCARIIHFPVFSILHSISFLLFF